MEEAKTEMKNKMKIKKGQVEIIPACPLKSGWQDSNLRPPGPKPGAIPGYATSRTFKPLIIPSGINALVHFYYWE